MSVDAVNYTFLEAERLIRRLNLSFQTIQVRLMRMRGDVLWQKDVSDGFSRVSGACRLRRKEYILFIPNAFGASTPCHDGRVVE
jgi:hypothetical protein